MIWLFTATSLYMSWASTAPTPGALGEYAKFITETDGKTILIIILGAIIIGYYVWSNRQFKNMREDITNRDERISILERDRAASDASVRELVADQNENMNRMNKELFEMMRMAAGITPQQVDLKKPNAPEQVIEAVSEKVGGGGNA